MSPRHRPSLLPRAGVGPDSRPVPRRRSGGRRRGVALALARGRRWVNSRRATHCGAAGRAMQGPP